MAYKKIQLQRIEEGLCFKCGGTKPDDGYVSCPDCREKRRAYNKAYRERRFINGLCVDCGAPVSDGSRHCPECREKRNADSKRSRKIAKENGLCIRCMKRKAAYGFVRCPECIEAELNYEEQNREKRKRYGTEWARKKRESDKANGICYTCHKRKATPGSTQCEFCRAKNRLRAERNRRKHGIISHQMASEYGLCYKCMKRKATHGKLCESCYTTSMKQINIINGKTTAE